MSTTINSYSIGLTLDASQYIQKSALSGQETRRLSRAIEEARTPAEKYSQGIDRLTKAVEKGAISLPVYSRLLENLGKKHGFVGQEIEDAAAKTQKLAEEQAKANRLAAAGETVTKSMMTAQERHSARLRELSELHKANAISAETYKRAVMSATEALKQSTPVDQRRNQLMAEGRQITASLMSPMEQHRQKVAQLGMLYKEGAISLATYNRAVAQSNPVEQQRNRLLQEGRQMTLSLLSPIEQHSRSLDRINALHRAGAIDSVTYRRAIEQADKSLKAHNKTTIATASASQDLIAHTKRLAVAYLGISTVTKSIKLAIDAERAAVQFEVLTGSMNNSLYILKQLREFADISPLSYIGTQDAARTLMAFGVEVQDVTKYVKMLGDVTGGNEERFKNMALAFAQATAAGRLQGQDLRQMIDAGFNPLQIIAEKTGESLDEVRERMLVAGSGLDLMMEAFEGATSAGGRFHGMTDRLAETMGGKLSIAMSDLEKSGISLGQAFGPVIIQLTEGFAKGESSIQKMIGGIELVIDGLGAVLFLGQDLVENVISLGNRGDDRFKSINAYLDKLEQRDRERAERQAGDANRQLDVEAGKVASMERQASLGDEITQDFDEQLRKLQLQTIELQKAEGIKANGMKQSTPSINMDDEIDVGKLVAQADKMREKISSQMKAGVISPQFGDAQLKIVDSLIAKEQVRQEMASKASEQQIAMAQKVGEAMKAAADGSVPKKQVDAQIAALQRQTAELGHGEEVAERVRLAAEGMSQAQVDQIMNQTRINDGLERQQEIEKKLAKEREKATKDHAKELERLAKAAEEAFTKDITKALEAATKHFEDERKKMDKMREEIAKGPGGDFEVGGAEAFQAMANQRNASIAARVMPKAPEPTDDAIVAEAKKQFAAQQAANAKLERQITELKAIATAVKENGFRRI